MGENGFRLKSLQNLNGSLKTKMERRRLVAKWLIKQRMVGLPRCRRAADAPSIAGFAKVSGCLLWHGQRLERNAWGAGGHGGAAGNVLRVGTPRCAAWYGKNKDKAA